MTIQNTTVSVTTGSHGMRTHRAAGWLPLQAPAALGALSRLGLVGLLDPVDDKWRMIKILQGRMDEQTQARS